MKSCPGLRERRSLLGWHRRRAGLPIVLVSGYIAPMLAERAHAAGATEILRKPVQSREFAQLC
jgi:CheY-like chemotaxis protein